MTLYSFTRAPILAALLFLGCSEAVASPAPHTPSLVVGDLRTEYQHNPLGIDTERPRLSWKIESSRRRVMQSAYQIRVSRSADALAKGAPLLFDTGKVASAESVQVRYSGAPLESRGRYYWQVRVWDSEGQLSNWSAPGQWEMGLLSKTDWQAQWIKARIPSSTTEASPSPMMRTAFTLTGSVSSARAYVTSRGLYELYINGKRVGDQVLTPGWTSYANRLQYQTYDVSALLTSGANAVGAVLGDGWYRGRLGPGSLMPRSVFENQLALLVQIEVRHEDGRTQTIITNGDWRAATGPVTRSEIYDGEVYDARLEHAGWTEGGFDDRSWSGVDVVPSSGAALVAAAGPPVRRMEERKPQRIFKTRAGVTVVDMGQNIAGWVRIRVRGRAGTTVTLRHAEVLDQQGELYTENLRSARQVIRYTLKGGGEEVFEPHFTYQGFRYVAVEGFPGEVQTDNITGVVVHADMASTGTLKTSSELINKLQQNIVWTQRGNLIEVPTDSPQRDERLGWTGDAQVFFPTAALNMDVAGFFTKWLQDLAAEQLANGGVPWEVPTITPRIPERQLELSGIKDEKGAAGWSDAITTVPWSLYLAYGDVSILESRYQNMVRWVEYERKRAGPDFIWDGDFQFGDWLAPALVMGEKLERTSPKLIATAYYAHSIDILRRSAIVLGKSRDVARYRTLLSQVLEAFRKEFVSADGRVSTGTQTAYVLALDFDLIPESLRPHAARELAADIRARGYLTTGILGTARLLNVLSRFGYHDEAYLLLTRTEYPSWLYPLARDATTVWERWDGIKPDGTFQDPGLNSFNHYAFGAVGEWMYRVMGGLDIDPAAPGYRHSFIRPQPGGGLTHTLAALDTRYGRLSSEWTIRNGKLQMRVEVPPNTRATVRLPRAVLSEVRETGVALKDAAGITRPVQRDDGVWVDLGSGKYDFSYAWDQT